ncbi:hypothetical protein ACFOPN_07035 [Xanthomonas hyacinthi]|uniref:hypothetical protein n=1 Tax=Xanthomonas hyacinthi TaxID=56455 RepID=UPI003617E894
MPSHLAQWLRGTPATRGPSLRQQSRCHCDGIAAPMCLPALAAHCGDRLQCADTSRPDAWCV